MPSKEIKELRQSGRLQEALEMAKAEFDADPGNIWTKRNLSWVYYEYLKASTETAHYDDFVQWLQRMVELELPRDEKMLFDSLAFQVGKMVFAILREEPIPVQKIQHLAELIRPFYFTKPSDAYSFILKGFHKGLKDTGYYGDFIDWWGLENLSSKDYLKETLPDGKEMMAMAEQVFISYAKYLLPKRDAHGEVHFDADKAHRFIPQLEALAEAHPGYQYPPYFQAKLLLALGDKEDMLSALIPFARKKQNDFWVWEILAEAVQSDPEKVFSCHCRALLCNSPEEMLVGARQKMAEAMVQKGLYGEAKTEIEQILKVKETQGHKVPAIVSNWMAQPWYAASKSLGSNKSFYRNHTQEAEDVLFGDLAEELVFVEFVNSDKGMLNFIASEDKFGFFKFDRFLKKVHPGEVLSVRFNNGAKGGRYTVLTCKKSSNEAFKSQFQKELEGTVKIKPGTSFGFLGDAYIHSSLVEKYKLVDGQNFKGQIRKTYDSKKEKWGWKLV